MIPSEINGIARTTRFDPASVEKVLRLKQILAELGAHPLLKDKLVLKGGTAINLFRFQVPRLSIDIDLNYVGQVERQCMLEERPEIERAANQVCEGLGYDVQLGQSTYALFQLHLGYQNHLGQKDRLKLEINFLMRACALDPVILSAASLGGEEGCRFTILATEELFAGKLKAMIERNHFRDLYDLYGFKKSGIPHDPDLLRRLAVLFAVTMPVDLRRYDISRYPANARLIVRELYPLLRSDDRPGATEMTRVVRPLLDSVLDHRREAPFLEAIANGQYEPGSLFGDHPDILSRVIDHPALLWKARNVRDYLNSTKDS